MDRGCKTSKPCAPCWLAAVQLLPSLQVFHVLPEVEEVLLVGWEETGSGGGVDMPQWREGLQATSSACSVCVENWLVEGQRKEEAVQEEDEEEKV